MNFWIYNLSKLNHEIINNLNRHITRMETESLTKSLSTNKSPELGDFIAEYYQIFHEFTTILHKPFKTIEETILPNSFCDAHITLIQSQRHNREKELQTDVPDKHRWKIPQQATNQQNPKTYQTDQSPG